MWKISLKILIRHFHDGITECESRVTGANIDMTLEDLGYNAELEEYRIQQDLLNFDVGRVCSEHKERYSVRTVKGEFEAEIIGSLRYSASSRKDFPAVGDWVSISEYDREKVLIHAVLPRKNVIERQAVGKYGESQLIASNIDFAFIVQAVDRDFNINRIERYLTICNASDVKPVILLNKIDLIDDQQLKDILESVKGRIESVRVFTISNHSQSGYANLYEFIEKGLTYCLLGSSGVGKSTLVNNLSGDPLMTTGSISEATKKGKHITSHREMIILKEGGIIIDNPGMREVGIADAGDGLEDTFDMIVRLSTECRFQNCTHVHESGCAVQGAVKNGELDRDSYENYLRLEREKAHFESSVAEKRKKDKDFGKMLKNFKKDQKNLDES